jgi:fused signal recognition particle receptor
MANMFDTIRESLAKTRTRLFGSLGAVLPFGGRITDEVLDEVEEVLYEADLGPHAAEHLIGELRKHAGEINRGDTDPYLVMRDAVYSTINRFENTRVRVGEYSPFVITVVGVNGVGKTTTIGKLAMRFRSEGRSVLLAACDTFRAAAVEQLGIWGERAGAEFIRAHPGADAASVAYDAVMRAKARSTDVVIVDTAGRLHTSRNLMEELKKIHKVIEKSMESAPHETLLVLDATTGQNAQSQAEVFSGSLKVTGIVLAKLDGTAKGGITVSIIDRLGIPVKLVGTGEGLSDLRDFDPAEFSEALFTR